MQFWNYSLVSIPALNLFLALVFRLNLQPCHEQLISKCATISVKRLIAEGFACVLQIVQDNSQLVSIQQGHFSKLTY